MIVFEIFYFFIGHPHKVAVDYPSRRIFYLAKGMPVSATRLISSNFDGSDKFRHFVITNTTILRPQILIYEDKVALTDTSRKSFVYSAQKYASTDKVLEKDVVEKDVLLMAHANQVGSIIFLLVS